MPRIVVAGPTPLTVHSMTGQLTNRRPLARRLGTVAALLAAAALSMSVLRFCVPTHATMFSALSGLFAGPAVVLASLSIRRRRQR